VEAAEQSDDSTKSSVYLLLTGSFQTFLQFDITVLSDIGGSSGTFVHKLHEGAVACFLELHILGEGLFNHVVHLLLEGEQFAGELKRIVE